MDLKRRYSQKRGLSKRKKCNQENTPPEAVDCSIEEEREFKLKRFVKDLNKYIEQKEKPLSKLPKKGTSLNMVQSKVWTRGNIGEEIKKKLDQSLKQIIGLENKTDCKCNCMQHCRSTKEPTLKPVVHTIEEHLHSQLPHYRITPIALRCNTTTPRAYHTSPRTNENKSSTKSTLSFDDLDNKLYPEFIRIVTLRCSQFKSAQFEGESYVHSLNKKLLAIYKRDCCSEECLTDKSRSDVATSPMAASPEPIEDSDQQFILNIVPDRRKSTIEFLKETIGPGSSVNESHYRDDESSSSYSYRPLPSEPGGHYSFMGREQPFHELPSVKMPLSPVYRYTQIPFDGGGDHLRFDQSNSFLPPCDEESPVFKYFPRRLF